MRQKSNSTPASSETRVRNIRRATRKLAAPYRHARLSAVKLAGGQNNPARFKDDATADELREEILRRLTALQQAGVLDLEALPAPGGEKRVTRSPASINQGHKSG